MEKLEIGNYEIQDCILGEGCYGSVRTAIDTRDEGVYAIKRIKKIYHSRTEADILSTLMKEDRNLPNGERIDSVLEFHDYFEVDDDDYPTEKRDDDHDLDEEKYESEEDMNRSGYLVTELIDGTDLFDLMLEYINEDLEFSEKDVLEIGKYLFQALVLLHRNNIVHRDIKLENVIVRRDDSVAKLIDFGLACWLVEGGYPDEMGSGTSHYLPPESYLKNYKATPEVWKKSDVYAAGIVLYALATSDFADDPLGYIDDKRSSLYAAVRMNRLKFPTNVHLSDIPSPDIKNIIRECIKGEPERRGTAEQILAMIEKAIKKL